MSLLWRALPLLTLACALCACRSTPPQPVAPYAIAVKDAKVPTTLRMDAEDRDAARLVADVIRAAQPILERTVGPAGARRTTVWLLRPESLDAYARVHRGAGNNAGAFTAVSRDAPQLYAPGPTPTATPEGDAVQRLHAWFVLAHEYTHVWLNIRTATGDLEEGFANWVAAQAMDGVVMDGMSMDLMPRLAVIASRLLVRSGEPLTIEKLLALKGDDAYLAGAALFFWLHEECGSDEAFRAVVRQLVTGGRWSGLKGALRSLREVLGARDLTARFNAWLDRAGEDPRWWWMPAGHPAVGMLSQDWAVMADDNAGVLMSFAQDGHLPEEAQQLDARYGAPPMRRVRRMEMTVHGEGLALDQRMWTKQTKGPVPVAGAPPFACAIVAEKRGVGVPLRDGEVIEFVCENQDVVVRRQKDAESEELLRWKGAACTPVVISMYGTLRDGRLPVLELRAREFTRPARP